MVNHPPKERVVTPPDQMIPTWEEQPYECPGAPVAPGNSAVRQATKATNLQSKVIQALTDDDDAWARQIERWIVMEKFIIELTELNPSIRATILEK